MGENSTTMIERVTAVIEQKSSRFGPSQTGPKTLICDPTTLAGLILTAMREPTEVMVAATMGQFGENPDADDAWREMIDAALAEKP